MNGPDQLGDLGLHKLLSDRPHRLADHVAVLIAQHLPDDLLDRHPLGTGHRWRLLSSTPWNEPTILSATVAGPTSVPSDRLLYPDRPVGGARPGSRSRANISSGEAVSTAMSFVLAPTDPANGDEVGTGRRRRLRHATLPGTPASTSRLTDTHGVG
jgi:hypothetical protein